MKNTYRKLNHRVQKGFTLVELLVVMGILGVLMVVLSQVFGAIIATKLRSESSTAVAVNSRFLLTRLAYDVTRSSQIVVPNDSTLVLTQLDGDYTYQLADETIFLTDPVGGTQALSGSDVRISTLIFTSYPTLGSKQSVGIDITLESTTIQPGGSTNQKQLITTYATRY